jgi:hypothetical protein
MKKRTINEVKAEVVIPDNIPFQQEEVIADTAEVTSIQEFIDLKKLQNRILTKMIEKINQPEIQDKSKSNNQ